MNPLEDMKAVYDEKICRIRNINFKSGLPHTYNIEIPEPIDSSFQYDVSCSGVDILLKFPDKDSKGSECWSGDLLKFIGVEKLYLLTQGKYDWEIYREDGSLKERERGLLGFFNQDYTRLCSIYDPEALEYLDQETIDKLKELIK